MFVSLEGKPEYYRRIRQARAEYHLAVHQFAELKRLRKEAEQDTSRIPPDLS